MPWRVRIAWRQAEGGGGVMAEDEDRQTAAVLAKLAEQDPGAAEDARAALEWVAGEQGRALITQERIQGFCWYELPVKWFVDLDEKLRVVAALAEALDLLQLPRYAAICRSGTTREILNAYEVSTARGKAAFRRAAAASGRVRPAILVSQHGCDTHRLDPLADLQLSIDAQRAEGAAIHDLVHQVAGGRWLLTGEGGYDLLQVVPRTWAHLLAEAAGRPIDPGARIPAAWREHAARGTGRLAPEFMT